MHKGSLPRALLSRRVRAAVAALLVAPFGCSERPISSGAPHTSGATVQDIRQSSIDQIDLLFVIDNSRSMADKQEILAQAVPALVQRLISPTVNRQTGQPAFDPIVDIHIGVVTSSLGGHGGDQCSKAGKALNGNDQAHLVASGIRPQSSLTSYQSLGFLWWDPTGSKATPPGEGDEAALLAQFAEHVTAAGENGCGYEASLEAWYRFLVDPAPPADVVVTNNVATVTGVDTVVLQQRKDFLRPDSLVAILLLSDESDCSIVDGGTTWMAAQTSNPNNTAYHLPRATSACEKDPNDVCCRSCASVETFPPTGCGDIANDSSCQQDGGLLDDAEDHPNLRCWDRKRRFGKEFLYPTRRYVEGLTQPQICPKWDADGPVECDSRVPNPLFFSSPIGAASMRAPGLIYFATIVGVPWQDIATDDSLSGPGLEYLTASELSARQRWDWLTPQCLAWVTDPLPRPVTLCERWDLADEPDDALMVESSLPRTGMALGPKVPIADPSAGPMANPVNGHEWNTTDSDLQYACIFPLATPLDCSGVQGCDCEDVSNSSMEQNPVCQGQDGSYSTVQRYAKAYPGVRQLEVARDFNWGAIVASICPKVAIGSIADPSYGYNPAVNTIIDRMKSTLAGQCLNQYVDLPKGADGNPDPALAAQACTVLEVRESWGLACAACDPSKNRTNPPAELVQPVLERLKVSGQCGESPNVPSCKTESWCMCELGLANDLNACLQQMEPNEQEVYGWCYLDATTDPPVGNPAVVAGCEPPRQFRFLGANTPAHGATMFLACQGAPEQ